MFKKYLSYLFPVNIFVKKSAFSKTLEVTWNDGELVLDSANTNYSYGSLQRILRTGLKSIGRDRILNMENILVLGVAGGSVIKILVNEIGFKGKITGVEIDKTVIDLANDYFYLNEIPNLEIVIDDASAFVQKTKDNYDLIIIDIFQDTIMPDFLFSDDFIQNTASILNINGFILFNTMILDKKGSERNKQYLSKIESLSFKTQVLPRQERHNELILSEKTS